MNEQKNNGRGIFYGVIGVATLVVAIIGATFAYFTATASNNVISGNMATVRLNLAVTKVSDADEVSGMIPMSNGMVEEAVETATEGTGEDETDICVDANGNAVCQIYKIVLTNDSSAGQFVDGYVTLTGGSGEPTDITTATNETTMRWAQVFCNDEVTNCSTIGTQYLLNDADAGEGNYGSGVALTTLANTSDGKNVSNIKTSADYSTVVTETTISGNDYDSITSNFIRISDHAASAAGYDREDDLTSALVYSHSITANKSVTYYIVVWLSETGTDQTAGSTGPGAFANADGLNFFGGTVTFTSAQGSEVSATFTGYTRVPAVETTPQVPSGD